MNKLLLYIMLLINASLTAMQLQKHTYNPEKTNMLKSLLNINTAREKLPEKEIVSLVSAGADPNVKADCGFCNNYNWLYILISRHAEQAGDLIGFLLHNGADPNSSGTYGCVLARACSKGNYASAALLIMAGAQVCARNYMGNSPLSDAVGDPKYPTLYRNAIMKLLLEKGAAADIHVTNNKGESPYSFAKKNGLNDVLELFEKYKHIKP